MTAPIPVYEDATIAGGRSTERGACYLTPNPEVRAAILYLFIHYAKQYNLRLLVLTIMSNHIHWVADDPDGRYPEFLAALYSRITEVLNELHGRSGPMWANCRPQRTRLLDDRTVEEKMLYAATNATWHGIEFRSRAWAGFCFSPEDVGRTIEVDCPQTLLDNYNSFPETQTYVVPKPGCYADMTDAEVRRRFRNKRNARELAISRERNKPFLGSRKALEATPEHIPTPEDDPRDLKNKLFDGATEEAIISGFSNLDAFRHSYASARRAFVAGERHVDWPSGTWAMRVRHNCPTCLA